MRVHPGGGVSDGEFWTLEKTDARRKSLSWVPVGRGTVNCVVVVVESSVAKDLKEIIV
jgi:hypothetical protein